MLIAYRVARELAAMLRPVVEQIERHDPQLADRLRCAATSAVANLADGQYAAARNKRRAFADAHDDARVLLGCLDCANTRGWTTDVATKRTLDRLLLLCWGLTDRSGCT
jgi:hypothetical protein